MDEGVVWGGSRLFEMLPLVEDWISDRKRRLFAVACCRRFAHLLADGRSRRALEVAERYADGLASDEERQAAEEDAVDVYIQVRESRMDATALVRWSRQAELLTQATVLSLAIGIYYAEDAADYGRLGMTMSGAGWRAEEAEEDVQCRLLRDVVGPLPPPRIEPAWLASGDRAVVQVAQSIYTMQAFDDMPILADALEDAGCADEQILAHCRQPGEHVRGCWVVDLCLGKS